MDQAAYTLFDTELGECGIVWRRSVRNNTVVVTGFLLPEPTTRSAETRIRRKWSADKAGDIPPPVRDIIKRTRRHFKGDAQDFSDVELELDGVASFAKRIYGVTRAIPSGRTMTYGKVAEAAGHAGAARAVGVAMSRNPVPLIIPCHRVLAAGSKLGGFSAYGGLNTKARMLEIEGATLGRPATIRSERDLKRIAALLEKKDPRLAPVLSRSVGFKLMRQDSPYHTLLEAVVHQQLSPKAAETILGRVAALYPGSKLPEPADLLETSDARLRGAGLSLAKTKALKDIAARTLDGTVPSAEEIAAVSDADIIKRLTSIFGVGQWTVEMMLIFHLGRMDILPADDYALRKSIADVFGMNTVPTAKEASKLGEAWRPYRTVASLYLWNMKGGGIDPA